MRSSTTRRFFENASPDEFRREFNNEWPPTLNQLRQLYVLLIKTDETRFNQSHCHRNVEFTLEDANIVVIVNIWVFAQIIIVEIVTNKIVLLTSSSE